jgi:tetratricopeptide (TPR) repeat protein
VPAFHRNLGILLVREGRYDEAFLCYAEALRLDPKSPRSYYLMGNARLDQGRSAEAVEYFRAALQLDPDDIESILALSKVFASDSNPRIRNGAEAVVLGERANALFGGQQLLALDTLAMAYAETARFDLARITISNALVLAMSGSTTDMVAAMQERQRLYQSNIPYREIRTNTPPIDTK